VLAHRSHEPGRDSGLRQYSAANSPGRRHPR